MEIEKLRKSTGVPKGVSISLLGCLIVALGVVLTAAGGCAGVTKGPVLLRVSEDQAALMWETEIEGPGEVLYGQGNRLDRKVTTEPLQVKYEIKKKGEADKKKTGFIHKAQLENLEPGRTYSYRVTGPRVPILQRIAKLGRFPVQNKVYKFRTVPADTNEVTFAVYGDSRSHPERHRKIVEQIIKKKVDFVVHSGDLVSSGDRYEQFGPQLFEPIKDLAETVPLYIAKGNHEGNSGNFERLLIPDGQTNSFGFDYGPVHYFCTDNVSKGLKAEEQLKLIVADARSSEARWKFVSYHIPSLNFGGHWSAWGYPDALRILAEAGVDFVMTGHSHQYERFRPLAPPGGRGGSYVTHITCGGGGAPLHDANPSVYHARAEAIHHFCLFHINENELTMDTFDIDGNVIDHLEIIKAHGRLNRQYLWTAVPMAAVRLRQDLLRTKPAQLPTIPEKGQRFNITCKLSVPVLGEPAKITFKLHCKEGTYEIPKPKILTIPREGGTFNVEFAVTALTDVKVTNMLNNLRQIDPRLWIQCRYEIGRVRKRMSFPIFVKP